MKIRTINRKCRMLSYAASVALVTLAFVIASAADFSLPNLLGFPDPSGIVRTYSTKGGIDLANPFFASLGSNGRACASCHLASDAWGVSAQNIRLRFLLSRGLDPIFRPVDGANCPTDDVSTLAARQSAYSQLLSKGLIRVSLPVPANAEFSLTAIDDPYHCASSQNLSLYRRPLPATNLRFLTTVMWDGRESFPGATLSEDLAHQAADATLGHAQATQAPTPEQLQAIVDFEMALSTAQAQSSTAGDLSTAGANGGPVALSQQPFYPGINDVLGGDPTGKLFDPVAMTLFTDWQDNPETSLTARSRAAIERGETLFNTLPITIAGVRGLNDTLNQPVIIGTCSSCHDSPNVGNHSLSLPVDIGIAGAERRTPDMPLYTFRCKTTGETIQLTDPGRALITGKCADLGKFKGPILRGLAARAPYFHNGSAASLADVVDFYNARFSLNLTDQQEADLAAFLSAL